MLSKFLFRLNNLSRRLWVKAALISALAVVAAGLAPVVAHLLPFRVTRALDGDDLAALLGTLVTSMLMVTTFALTVMVSTHLHADQAATPRAHRLLREDTRTQTVLATFLGAFVYGLTATVILDAGLITEGDVALIYLATLLVFALIVVAILRWIAYLSRLGSVEETLRRVEERARQAIRLRMSAPHLGGHPLLDPARQIPSGTHVVAAPRSGFVQHVDGSRLSRLAETRAGRVWLLATPGDWLDRGAPLAHVAAEGFDGAAEAEIADCVTLGDVRTYTQDPGFGLIVLTEIAQRALSPGINDPRTAMDVLSRLSGSARISSRPGPGMRPPRPVSGRRR